MYGRRTPCVREAYPLCTGGAYPLCTLPPDLSTGLDLKPLIGRTPCVPHLDGLPVPLSVGLDEVEEVGAGVFRRDAFALYPVKILVGEVGHVPFPG